MIVNKEHIDNRIPVKRAIGGTSIGENIVLGFGEHQNFEV
jgi:hypothetical protein